MNEAAAAKSRLQALANQLEADHPGAATSLREGLDETLTVRGMKLPTALERTLSTTNPIENLNGGIPNLTHRVKRSMTAVCDRGAQDDVMHHSMYHQSSVAMEKP
jgi:hypothetical protein